MSGKIKTAKSIEKVGLELTSQSPKAPLRNPNSRIKKNTEWKLSSRAYEKIVSKFMIPHFDLSTSRINAKCQAYCSWYRDPDALAVAAFTINWKIDYFYAFPPFALVLRFLQKVIADRAYGIAIVPNWPSQPWISIFMNLLVGKPIIFTPAKWLLLSLCRSFQHPLQKSLGLIAGKLPGNLTAARNSRIQ